MDTEKSPDHDETPAQTGNAAKRQHRFRKLVIILAVLASVLGIAAAAVGYYVSTVPMPETLTLPEATVVYYSDGKTEMARLGDQDRTVIDTTALPPYVAWAVMSAEDRSFETNAGVDLGDLVRGAVGGADEDGAATITMQYARMAADLSDGSRPDVAVMAWKLNDRYTKAEIMGFYLNTVYFGRGAYGIEAAARAYFKKPATSLSLGEAMVLAAVIRSPGDSAFDPSVNPRAAQDRWAYIRDGLTHAMKKLPADEAAALAYPETVVEWSPNVPSDTSMLDRPTGLVVQQALSELRQLPEFRDKPAGYLRNGGLKIVTTIDKEAERLAIALADASARRSHLAGKPKGLQAALVAIEPGTGRVLAYFGGHNGAGADYAGWYYDEHGAPTGYGAHPPGATFAIYDVAAALKEGISLKSYWDANRVKAFPRSGRTADRPVRENATADCQPTCTLLQAARAGLTVPLFGLTEQVGVPTVLDMARAAGVRDMWARSASGTRRVDVRAAPDQAVLAQFGTEVGIGQYPVTVIDQAGAMATFAAGGVRAQTHFVKEVTRAGATVYAEKPPTGAIERVLSAAAVADLSHTFQRRLADGQDAAVVKGTWQYANSATDVAHAWTIGYTRRLAVAVWTGNQAQERPLRLADGRRMTADTIAGPIFRDFTVRASKALGLAHEPFDPPAFLGDASAGNAPPPR